MVKTCSPYILVCIVLCMVCMTDNKLITCVNRNTPGWQMWKLFTESF